MSLAKNLFIKTFGCQMNVYDSARMADVLAPLGYRLIEGPEDADLVILNTCHIREKAAEKVYSELGRLRALKEARRERGEGMIVAVAGCVAQAEGALMMGRAPVVDVVVGPQAYHRLPAMVTRAARAGGGVLDTEFPAEPKFDFLPQAALPQGAAAYLTVQEGCDKFCTFCVVPYTRGAEYSRPVVEVEAEARRLVALRAREITLLGQNVNAYHGTGPDGAPWSLGRLIRRLARIDGLARIRYTTSHPRDVDDELVAAHREVPELMPFVHLPLQSGSDRILKAMNRRHRADDYRRVVDRFRAARPDVALASDFIVGFPAETEAEFAATLALVDDIGFAQAYSFKYSPRPGTPAAEAPDQVPEAVKRERLARLQAVLDEHQLAFNRASVGAVMPVLLADKGRHPGQLVGRSPWMQAVHVRAPEHLQGEVVECVISEGLANSLSGRLVAAPASSSEAHAA